MSGHENHTTRFVNQHRQPRVVNKVEQSMDATKFLDELFVYLVENAPCTMLFKGGYTLSKILPNARATSDIDFSIGDKNDYQHVLTVLKEFGDIQIRKGTVQGYFPKLTITPTMSGGIVYKSTSGCNIASVDVGLHQVTRGTQNIVILNKAVKIFSTERMLADKLSVVLSERRFRRSKDLYDIYIITSAFQVNMQQVREHLSERNPSWKDYPFSNEILIKYRKAYGTLTLINPRTGEFLEPPAFELCIGVMNALLAKVQDAKG